MQPVWNTFSVGLSQGMWIFFFHVTFVLVVNNAVAKVYPMSVESHKPAQFLFFSGEAVMFLISIVMVIKKILEKKGKKVSESLR